MRYLHISFSKKIIKCASGILMYVIAVNKWQKFVLNVRRLFYIFRRRRKGFDFDDESMFFSTTSYTTMTGGCHWRVDFTAPSLYGLLKLVECCIMAVMFHRTEHMVLCMSCVRECLPPQFYRKRIMATYIWKMTISRSNSLRHLIASCC